MRLMIEALFNSENYLAAKKLMDASILRQEAVLTNLANLETPGFKRLKVAENFESALTQAIQKGKGSALKDLKPKLEVDANAAPIRGDGNTVSLEKELLALNRNTLEHNLLAERISGHFHRIELAIKGS